MEETGFAKLNLALHVRERMPDGYHRIETLFAFAEGGDRLRVGPGDALALRIEGPFAPALGGEADNLVLKAARALRARSGIRAGADLRLEKNLPVAAGLGGGSADAAAALRLLSRWWGLSLGREALLDLAAGLGADVPACLDSVSVRGEGRGDALVDWPTPDLAGKPVLLVNPRVPLSTPEVFAAWDGVDRGPLHDWRQGRNDLQAPAASLAPAVADVVAALSDAEFARLSGSGATCFGLYPDVAARDRAARRIAADRPGWWVMPTRLR